MVHVQHIDTKQIYTLNGGDSWTLTRFNQLKEARPMSKVAVIDINGDLFLVYFVKLKAV